MTDEIVGTLISGITGIGTSQDDTHAYVEVQINNEPSSAHYLMFEASAASGIVAAFMSATTLVQDNQSRRAGDASTIFQPFPVKSFTLVLGSASNNSPSSVVSAELDSGAKIHLLASNEVLGPPAYCSWVCN